MRVTILQGIPGAGKSSLIPFKNSLNVNKRVVSADAYFTDAEGNYRFDPTKLPQAHARCLREYTTLLTLLNSEPQAEIVVDNTNTTVAEVAPYYALAQAYGYAVRIVYLPCYPEVAAARNLHGVTREGCERMAATIQQRWERECPIWWRRVTASKVSFNWETDGW